MLPATTRRFTDISYHQLVLNLTFPSTERETNNLEYAPHHQAPPHYLISLLAISVLLHSLSGSDSVISEYDSCGLSCQMMAQQTETSPVHHGCVYWCERPSWQ